MLFCSDIIHIFALDSVSPCGLEGQNLMEKGRLRTFSSRSKSRKFELSSKERNGASALGVLYTATIYHDVG